MNNIKKLLSVIPSNRPLFFRGLTQFWSRAIYPLISIHFLTVLVQDIEGWFFEDFKSHLIMYGIFFWVFHIFVFLIRDRWRPELWPEYKKQMHYKYMKEFIYLDNVWVESIGTWRMISIIEKWFHMRSMLLTQLIESGTALLFTIVYVAYVFWWIGANFFLWFILFWIIIGVGAYLFNNKMLLARKKRVIASNMYVKYLVRIVMSKFELMQNRQQDKEMARLDGELDKQIEANKWMNPYIHRFFFWPNLLIGILRIWVFYILWAWVISGSFSFSEFVAIWASLVLLDEVMWKWLLFYKDLTKHFDIISKLWETFDTIKIEKNFDEWDEFQYTSWDMKVESMTFWYSNMTKVFDWFDLELMWGKKTALVGESGSWKSTLVKLISWYIVPESWSIYVDEQKLSSVSLKSYYSHIGYLTQDPSVFDWTVWDNLTYGMEFEWWKDEEKIKNILDQAIKNSKCEFVYDFPDGLHTEIWEKWVRLSWWQKQRLAIAKIFLKDPKIIILDEPTSALDSFSEEAITEAMHNLFEWRTVIIIAHRLQTVKQADDIILLEEGKVMERGTHEELVKLGGKYNKMLELQSWF